MAEPVQKKRHHYVPIAYLARFADTAGRIYAYRKDGPFEPLHLRPSEIAFERYYYSQPLPDGGRDNNTLEDRFSEVETLWPGLVENLSARRPLGPRLEEFFAFIGLMRVRTPAARDPIELLLAQMVRQAVKKLKREGRLPPPPAGFERLYDHLQISIDPHRSLLAMPVMMQGFAQLLEQLSFEVVHNRTDEDFVTSDNPVIYFNPDAPEEVLLPYTVRPPFERVEFLMPLAPRLLLRGRTGPPLRRGMEMGHVALSSRTAVKRVNRLAARFGYRFVFARHGGLEPLVARHAALSPTISFSEADHPDLEGILNQMVFAPRPRKPRWNGVK